MTDWGSGTGSLKDQVGVGWTSVWVKMVSQWLTVAAYMCAAAEPRPLETPQLAGCKIVFAHDNFHVCGSSLRFRRWSLVAPTVFPDREF